MDCRYCDEPAIAGVGKDNVPVCAYHFDKVMGGVGSTITRTLVEAWERYFGQDAH